MYSNDKDEVAVCEILPEQIELANQLAKKRKREERIKRWKRRIVTVLLPLLTLLVAILAWLFPRTNQVSNANPQTEDLRNNQEESEVWSDGD